ncbi:Alkyl hydroperoxide reductase subunit C/ Thiol specific antioxidant [Cynara cardunculus var. scolymus]|uniref:Alkyl hydroperoxide reductase subunit C/ Thiol specific antioxidant n=1 Tax=Cynara cardunculus var. scolymus TaxID=59895 RepID=A0A103XFH1_CYNCS|nr:Alkyl hydroperoxide reductase subunit C/ Thiol specific antioxidant [Cynara cardunculus var. scolymus]
MPGLTIGDSLPNLQVDTTHGAIKLHDYVADSFTIIFSHPGDFTPVCTTELGAMAAYAHKFKERGVKLLGLSCDDVQSHKEWIKDIEAYNNGKKVTYPIAADPTREIIKQLNMASKHKIATPANWKDGEEVVIAPSVSNDEARKLFPGGFKTADLPSKKDYIRFTHV